MQNKKLFKILTFVALFLIIIFLWIVIKDAQRKKILNIMTTSTGLENPFGGSDNKNNIEGVGGKTATNSQENQTNPMSGTSATFPSDTKVVFSDNTALKQISTQPVAGYTFTSEERELPLEPAVTKDKNIVETFDFSGYKTINFGDKTDEIMNIKTVLNRLNPSPNLKIDNIYDTDMKNSVVGFQNSQSLTGDGVIGPATYAKLNEFQGIKTFTARKNRQNTEIVPLVRYVTNSSGQIYDQALNKAEEAKNVASTKIPYVVEAFFDNTATKVVLRYAKDDVIQTYLANMTFPKNDDNATGSTLVKAAVSGDFLPENIKTVALSRDQKNFFYMTPVSGGVSGINHTFANKAKKGLIETPLTEWIADFGSSQKINLTTKASGLVFGYSYSLDTKNGNLSKNIGKVNGLTSLLSPDGKKLFYSVYNDNKTMSSFILDIQTGKKSSVSPSILADKCVWASDSKFIYCGAPVISPQGLYPDDWYKGKISFNDALWEIDATSMTGNIVYDFVSKNNKSVDAIDLRLDPTNNYLGFINKKDNTLWVFDLAK